MSRLLWGLVGVPDEPLRPRGHRSVTYTVCVYWKRPRTKQGWRRLEVAAMASQDEESRGWTVVGWRKHSLHKHVGESSDPQH